MRRIRHWFVRTLLMAMLVTGMAALHVSRAAAACNESLGFGKVDNLSLSIASADAGSYRVWSRLQVPVANQTYMIEIDGTCYTVAGGSTLNQWVWSGNQSNGSPLNVTLATGSHTIRLFGTSEGVLLDRVIFTKDGGTTCNPPVGTGDTCVSPPDTTAPTVNILSPVSGTTINSGSATLTASATDVGGAVAKVEYYLNGVSGGPTKIGEATATPYNVAWNTSAIPNGTYTVTAKVYDNASPANVGNSTVANTVTIANGQPNLIITSLSVLPASPKVNDNVTVSAVVKNNGPVATGAGFRVKFMVGSTTLTPATTSGSLGAGASQTFTTTWKPTTGGSYTLSAAADDLLAITESSESDNSANLTVAVSSPDLTPPTVSITAPANNATNLSGTVPITASATDNTGGSGMQKVAFLVDDIKQQDVTSGSGATHNYSWDTTKVANGQHKLSVIAYDIAGNVSSTINITVTVNNVVVLPPIPGDANGDRKVNYSDLLAVVNNWGLTGRTKAQGNVDEQGTVNYADLLLVINNWTP